MENYLKLVTPEETKLKSLKSYELRNSRLFVMFLHITFIPLFCFTVLNYLSGKPLAGHIDLIGFLSFITILGYYKVTGHYKLSVISYVLVCQVVISSQHLIAPASLGTNLLWAPLIIVVTSYLLGKKWGIRLGILNAFIMIAAETLPRFYQIPMENFLPQEIINYNISIIVVTTLSAFLVIDRILLEERTYLKNLEQQKQDLFEEKEAKAALLNIIAHDIANPLTLIQGRLSYLIRQISDDSANFDPDKVRKHLNQLISRSGEIAKNIELIRQYRAYETGKLEIKLTTVDLNKVLDSSIEVFHEKIQEKRLHLYKDFEAEENYIIRADSISLQMSVINNLLSNAIKFSHPGGIIRFSISQDDDIVEFKIRDYGIGIPEEIKPFIFSAERPTSRKGTQGEEGTGFGMPILKMFLDKYGAEIEIGEPAEGGSLFTIRFIRAGTLEMPKVVTN